jgi:hypothetical protein
MAIAAKFDGRNFFLSPHTTTSNNAIAGIAPITIADNHLLWYTLFL